MTLLIGGLRMPLGLDESALPALLASALKIAERDIEGARLFRRALDARKKNDLHFQIQALATLDAALEAQLLARGDARIRPYALPACPPPSPGGEPPRGRIVVAGLGPAGLFCALRLAEYGYAPLVLERGLPAEARAERVESFFGGGPLDPECNVMYGEGGAGAFSDGKLTSRSKDARGRLVLETLARFGAPEEILIDAKPHIGTDRLRLVVAAMRREIERLGGAVRFSARLTDIDAEGVLEINGAERLRCAALALAVGQGARDTFRMLSRRGLEMRKKAFAAGLRVEHPQALIDLAQLGAPAARLGLGAASYALTAESGGRGVYSFCMCPGGRVIQSASAPNEVAVNGMSCYARDGENANAAIVVQVREADCPPGALGGVEFCEALERAAFLAGGGDYFAPASRLGDFLERKTPRAFGALRPSCLPGVRPFDLWRLLPGFIAQGVADGARAFSRQLRGFDLYDAVLTGVETRTSAPLRLERQADMRSVSHDFIYPVGEGAGYAGGIVSAAIDGLRAADALIARFARP
ncbi:MAG: hypothetical protein Q4C13_05805 [Clostridia bacterium]|nr:hypothetical protein [Clostridia bacterium]